MRHGITREAELTLGWVSESKTPWDDAMTAVLRVIRSDSCWLSERKWQWSQFPASVLLLLLLLLFVLYLSNRMKKSVVETTRRCWYGRRPLSLILPTATIYAWLVAEQTYTVPQLACSRALLLHIFIISEFQSQKFIGSFPVLYRTRPALLVVRLPLRHTLQHTSRGSWQLNSDYSVITITVIITARHALTVLSQHQTYH